MSGENLTSPIIFFMYCYNFRELHSDVFSEMATTQRYNNHYFGFAVCNCFYFVFNDTFFSGSFSGKIEGILSLGF